MMANTFIISDTHFGHQGILGFKAPDGINKLRDFSSVEEMDEHIIERWNSVVRDQDKVYHLGDVAMRKEHIATMSRLNGKKTLIMGNHDIFDSREYLQYFENVRAYKVFDGTKIIFQFLLKAKEDFA
jgi:calcineurin-like phosphoesterase family protein